MIYGGTATQFQMHIEIYERCKSRVSLCLSSNFPESFVKWLLATLKYFQMYKLLEKFARHEFHSTYYGLSFMNCSIEYYKEELLRTTELLNDDTGLQVRGSQMFFGHFQKKISR